MHARPVALRRRHQDDSRHKRALETSGGDDQPRGGARRRVPGRSVVARVADAGAGDARRRALVSRSCAGRIPISFHRRAGQASEIGRDRSRNNRCPGRDRRCGNGVQDLDRLKGVGKASAHFLMNLLGHYDHISVDSATYAYAKRELFNGRRPTEKQIRKRFAEFGEWQSLVYWFARWDAQLAWWEDESGRSSA